jgi:hypothetical protein
LTADYSILSTFLFSTFPIGHTHPRPSLLSTTSSSLSPVHSYGGYATSLFIRLDSTLREIWIHCYERLHFNITIDLVFESHHTPAVYFYRRYELTNLSTFLFSTIPIGHKHPRPSLLSTTSSPLSPVYSDGGGSAPNDGHLCLLYTSLLVDKHPPSIFTLHDFVVAFAGLF